MADIWNVYQGEAGMKLLAYLSAKLKGAYSSRHIKRAIENNLCFVNGIAERFATYKLRMGDAVKFDVAALELSSGTRVEIQQERILFQDDHLLVYNKPSGITSDETGLLALLPGCYAVHRLDRETSGVIIVAKTAKMQEAMYSLFKQRGVRKVYLALVDGVPKHQSGVVENYLGKISRQGKEPRWGSVPPGRGKPAKTLWKIQKIGTHAALLKCEPETGRTHQIRVHMKQIGHPILGDYRYTKKYHCPFQAKRCMLHALEVEFVHPNTGRRLHIKAPIAKDFRHVIE